MTGQTTAAGHVMNYSVDGSVFLVINPCFIPCNNALRKFLSLIGVTWVVHGGTVPRVLSSCEVLWHQTCTHFLCSCWPWTVLLAPVSETPCSLRFMYYVLSDMHICTTLSPVADVPGRLDRCCCQHLPCCYQTHICVHNITHDTHTSPTTGHELPPVRKESP